MKTKHRPPIAIVLLTAFLLAFAGTASAANIIVEGGVTATLSSLMGSLQPTDTITVRTGGALWVDNGDTEVTIAGLQIGDDSSVGSVLFSGVRSTLKVTGDVKFGTAGGAGGVYSVLDMAFITPSTPHTLRVGGKFLAVGSGRFMAGAGTIEYYAISSQDITASVGGTGAITYKNLVLSGSPATGTAPKVFASGVSVQGVLLIKEKAEPKGAAVSYGSLSTLVYNMVNGQTMITTGVEWPTTVGIPVLVTNVSLPLGAAATLELNADKTINAVASPAKSLTVSAGTVVKDAGKVLTVRGEVLNNGAFTGTGRLELAGSVVQALTGVGTYGNVTINTTAADAATGGASLPGDNDCSILGRLIIARGKLTLPSGIRQYSTALATFGGADRPGLAIWGGPDSLAANKNDAFAGPGSLTVQGKLPAVVSIGNDHQQAVGTFTNVYGDASVTITGVVTTAAAYLPFGNGPQNENVTVTITPPAPAAAIVVSAPLANDGAYSITLTTTTVPAGIWPIKVQYAGGLNAGAAELTAADPLGFKVSKRPVKIIATATGKVFDGLADEVTPEPLPYTTVPPEPGVWVVGDVPQGKLLRARGEAVGTYLIGRGTFAENLNPNYEFTYEAANFTITQREIVVTPNAKDKVYGQNDPDFTYTRSQEPYPDDYWDGKLGRETGETAKTYKFIRGSLTIKQVNGTESPNYKLTLVNNVNVFTIKQLELTVTLDNQVKTYGQADPVFTHNLASLVVVNPALGINDSFTGAPGRATGSDAGDYALNLGGLKITPATSESSYKLTASSAKLTINKRPVLISAANQSVQYGDPVDYTKSIVYEVGVPAGTRGKLAGESFDRAPTIKADSDKGLPVQGSPQGDYKFTLDFIGEDNNYTPERAGNPADDGTITITRRDLNVVADNKTKKADGSVFPYTDFSVRYEYFLDNQTPPDTEANSITGTKVYEGSAKTNTAPGVYVIVPSGLSSTKYALKYVNGWLAITDQVRSNYVDGAETWGGVNTTPAAKSNLVCYINQANGNPGSKPGWTIRVIKNKLTVNATAADPLRIHLVTTLDNDSSGAMKKFDPTRPYSWEVVRANGGFENLETDTDGTVKDVLLDTSFFVNGTFGGKFKVAQEGNSLFVKYSPVGPTGMPDFLTAIPDGYNVDPVLSDVGRPGSDLDVLYLAIAEADKEITPQERITVDLNVASLQQYISGVEAYIAFSSTMFATEGPGAPVVVPGMGDWKTLIFTNWNQGGDLDAVIGVSLGNSAGTKEPGTVAKITLTPNRTSTGKSRVTFRRDGANDADYQNGTTGRAVTNSLIAVDGGIALPARVMTPEILITVDGNGPEIDPTGVATTTQVQPHVPVAVNVKGGANPVVQTSSGISASTVSGPVIITIPIVDKGVGIAGVPRVWVTNTANDSIELTDTGAPGTAPGTFVYQWSVGDKVRNTDWYVRVIAQDTLTTPNKTTNANVAKLTVNTKEISGIVEVELFKGTNRWVTFMGGTESSSTKTKAWSYNLSFKSYEFMSAGAVQDRTAMANKVIAPPATDPLSTYLRYGSVLDMPALASNLRNQGNGVAAYVHALLYGYVQDLPKLALTLQYTNRAVDVYIRGLLPQTTKDILTAYLASPAANSAALTRALLDDFNNIALGGAIYNEVRFEYVAGATACGTSTSLLPGSDECVAQNRCHLMAAYPQFVAGELRAQTAQSLAQYPGSGYDATLANYILGDFDTLTKAEDLWPDTWRFDCLYDETNFLGVVLSDDSQYLLTKSPEPTGAELTLLNQYLLEDAFAGQFEKAPLTPETIAIAQGNCGETTCGPADFEAALVRDLNDLIKAGQSIYRPERFSANQQGAVDSNIELSQLLARNPSGTDLVRMNRLLLEVGYSVAASGAKLPLYLLSESVLATYRLVAVPDTTVKVQAKTDWNLGVQLPVSGMMTTANFVNNGTPAWNNSTPGWTGALDNYLRGGDLVTSETAGATGDNVVNLLDYNVMRQYYGNTADPKRLRADVDGDNLIEEADYALMKRNWAKTGSSPLLK